jgi:hypothetical protein
MRKTKNYLVGFDSDEQVVYGQYNEYCNPVTLVQAKRQIKELTCGEDDGVEKVIYMLVPVKGKP